MRCTSQISRFRSAKGFTLIEVLIIAPVVILAISGFVALMVTMTSDILVTRDHSNMAFETQDALDRIEQDVRISTQFLVTSGALFTPQGSNNNFTGTSAFTSTTGTLILGSLTTDKNPADSTRQLVYYAGQPNLCGAQQSYNRVLLAKVMYFLKDGDLWRRAALPNYNTNVTLDDETVCSAPWQRNTCSPGYSPATRCQTNDTMVMENVDSFAVKYFSNPNSTVDIGPSQALAASTIEVTLNGKKLTSGQDITSSGSMRATKLNNIDVDLPIPNVPTVTGQVNPSTQSVTFSWAAVPLASSYAISYNINGGSWVNATTNSQTTSYTVSAARTDTITITVYARNSSGSSNPGTAAVTIPAWYTPGLQSNWGNFDTSVYPAANYTKTSADIVVLKGVIASGTTTPGTTIFTLPVGYRPTHDLQFQTDSNFTASNVAVSTNGNVSITRGSSTWLVLDGIRFVSSTASYAWTSLSFQNGWGNFGGTSAPLRSTLDSVGRAHFQGVVRNGTYADATTMAALPAGQQASEYTHVPAASSVFNYTAYSWVIQAKGVSASQTSYALQAMFYPTTSGWATLTLSNGWQADAGYTQPRYRKGSDGIVTVKGLIKNGLTTPGTILATLPAGYRPKERICIAGVSAGTHSRVDILPTGEVVLMSGWASWTSLDNISFIAEQ